MFAAEFVPLASSLRSSYDNDHCRCKTCPCESGLFSSSQSIASRCATLLHAYNLRFRLRTSSAKRTERLRSQTRRNTQSSQSFSATGRFSCRSLPISHACSLFSQPLVSHSMQNLCCPVSVNFYEPLCKPYSTSSQNTTIAPNLRLFIRLIPHLQPASSSFCRTSCKQSYDSYFQKHILVSISTLISRRRVRALPVCPVVILLITSAHVRIIRRTPVTHVIVQPCPKMLTLELFVHTLLCDTFSHHSSYMCERMDGT